MEMSHRGKEYEAVIRKAEADLRKLLSVPDNYKILFLQGAPTVLQQPRSLLCMEVCI
jgi:phosphoserine aminotransferase